MMGGGVAGAGAATPEMRKLPVAADAVGARLRAMISLAAEVPSAPQAGQATGKPVCPFTGSTSKA